VAAEQEPEPVAAEQEPEQVVAEPEPVEPGAGQPVGAAAAAQEASIGQSSRSPIALKRPRTTSPRALPVWSGAPRSTGALCKTL
jgi:hypothetical protein